jgi:hypothetical protein
MRIAVPLMLAVLWVSTNLALESLSLQASMAARLSALGQLVWRGFSDMTNVGTDRAPPTIERMGNDRQIAAAQPRIVHIELPIESQSEPDKCGLWRLEILVRHQVERFEPALCPLHQPLSPLPARPLRS